MLFSPYRKADTFFEVDKCRAPAGRAAPFILLPRWTWWKVAQHDDLSLLV